MKRMRYTRIIYLNFLKKNLQTRPQSLALVPSVPPIATISRHSCNNSDSKTTRLKPVLTLYTKEDCSLCDDAKEVLQPEWDRFDFEEVDITEDINREWFDKYKYDTPVFHLNGRFLMKHKVNLKLLDRRLKELDDNS